MGYQFWYRDSHGLIVNIIKHDDYEWVIIWIVAKPNDCHHLPSPSSWPGPGCFSSTPGRFGEVPTEIGCQRCGPDGGFCVARRLSWVFWLHFWMPQLTNENARVVRSMSIFYMNLYDLYVFGLGFSWSLGRAPPFGPQEGAATPSTQCNLLYLLHLEPEACCESEAKSYGKR